MHANYNHLGQGCCGNHRTPSQNQAQASQGRDQRGFARRTERDCGTWAGPPSLSYAVGRPRALFGRQCRQHFGCARDKRRRIVQVILVDANLLIYAHVESFPQHGQAREWIDAQLTRGGPVGLPWASLLAFLRIVTNPRVFERPEPIADAWRQVDSWLDAESVWNPGPTERH